MTKKEFYAWRAEIDLCKSFEALAKLRNAFIASLGGRAYGLWPEDVDVEHILYSDIHNRYGQLILETKYSKELQDECMRELEDACRSC